MLFYFCHVQLLTYDMFLYQEENVSIIYRGLFSAADESTAVNSFQTIKEKKICRTCWEINSVALRLNMRRNIKFWLLLFWEVQLEVLG